MEHFAIIVAGGSGERIGSEIPKQFREVNGKPILQRTLETFREAATFHKIVIVLPGNHFSQWERICKTNDLQVPHTVTKGGENRFHSVKNGLDQLPDKEGLVLVHDGVRPLVSRELIHNALTTGKEKGNAVPAIDLRDTIRKINEDGTNESLPRAELKAIQTPQCFHLERLKKGFEQPYRAEFTDEANVMDSFGEPVNLIEGDPDNIKITFPLDLHLASTILDHRDQ